MTSRTNIIIAISAIVVFAAVVGFVITLGVSPQIAYARLFIDAGLVIGLVAAVMAFHRERELPTGTISHALKNLRDGHYKTRITDDAGPLEDIAKAINELAQTLGQNHEKQEEAKRNLRAELLPDIKPKDKEKEKDLIKEMVKELKEPVKEKEPIKTMLGHSHHPELGPVVTIAQDFFKPAPAPVAETVIEKPFSSLSNILIDSEPPKAAVKEAFIDQDMGELYERFIEAQRALNQDKIEYHLFLKTIETTRNELMSSHKCQGILFDIVANDQVALQPKIIR